jgi:hypothetical protein
VQQKQQKQQKQSTHWIRDENWRWLQIRSTQWIRDGYWEQEQGRWLQERLPSFHRCFE